MAWTTARADNDCKASCDDGKDDGNKTSGRSVVYNNQKSGVGSTLPQADEVGFQSILMTLLRLVLTLPSMQEKGHQRRPRGVPLV